MIAVLIEKGFCSYTDIKEHRVTLEDVFMMLHLHDWLQYRDSYAIALAQAQKR